MRSDKYLSGFNQVSSFVRHLLAFGSFAGETPALPAMRSELCWTMRADERKDRKPPDQALAKSGRLIRLVQMEGAEGNELSAPSVTRSRRLVCVSF